MKNLIFIFLLVNAILYSQECGEPGHSQNHDNNTPDDTEDDLSDPSFRTCYQFDQPVGDDLSIAKFPEYIFDINGDGVDENNPYVPDEIIVKLNPEFNAGVDLTALFKGEFGIEEIDGGALDELLDSQGLISIEPFSETNEYGVFLLKYAHYKNIIDLKQNLEGLGYQIEGVDKKYFSDVVVNIVDYSENRLGLISNNSQNNQLNHFNFNKYSLNKDKNSNIPIDFFYTPDDPLFYLQWHLNPIDEDDFPSHIYEGSIEMDRAWSLLGGNYSVKNSVTVVDDPIDSNHPEFSGVINYHSQNVLNDPLETHGNEVVGVLAAKKNNKELIAGVTDAKINFFGFGLKPIVVDNGFLRTLGIISQSIGRAIWDNLTEINEANDFMNNPNNKTNIVNLSYKFREATFNGIVNPDMYEHFTDPNLKLVVIAAGNEFYDLDALNNLYKDKYPQNLANSDLYEHFMLIGGIDYKNQIWNDGLDDKGNPSGSNFGSRVSVVAPAKDILTITSIKDGIANYDNVDGNSFAAPIVSGIASYVEDLLGTQSTPYEIRKVIETTAEKARFYENEKTYFTPTKITGDYAVRNKYLARGNINAHQAFLLSKAKFKNENVKEVDRSDGMKKTMDYDQFMFSKDKKYGFALNRTRMTGYRLEADNTGSVNYHNFNHGAIWDTPTLLTRLNDSGLPYNLYKLETYNSNYSKSLVLDNEDFYIENFFNKRNWEAKIPIPNLDHRSLVGNEIEGVCVAGLALTCGINDENGGMVLSNEESAKKHDTKVALEEKNLKAQWFQISKNDGTGPNPHKKGDLIVKRRYKSGDRTKIIIAWKMRSGVVDDYNARRFLAEEHIYQKEDRLTNEDELTDSEYIKSPDGSRMLAHHNGEILVLNNEGNRWIESLSIHDSQSSNHDAHRLLIKDGVLQFEGGYESNEYFEDSEDDVDEYVGQITFNSSATLKTFEDCSYPKDYTNYKLAWHADSRKLIFKGDEIPLYGIIPPDAKRNAISTNQKLVEFSQLPGENEVNMLISEDGSKATIQFNNEIKVLPIKNNHICLQEPIQSYRLQ